VPIASHFLARSADGGRCRYITIDSRRYSI